MHWNSQNMQCLRFNDAVSKASVCLHSSFLTKQLWSRKMSCAARLLEIVWGCVEGVQLFWLLRMISFISGRQPATCFWYHWQPQESQCFRSVTHPRNNVKPGNVVCSRAQTSSSQSTISFWLYVKIRQASDWISEETGSNWGHKAGATSDGSHNPHSHLLGCAKFVKHHWEDGTFSSKENIKERRTHQHEPSKNSFRS